MPSRNLGCRLGVISRKRGGSVRKRSRYQIVGVPEADRSWGHRIVLPQGARPEFGDAERLWADLETFETRRNACLARTIDLPLPRDLPIEACDELAGEIAARFSREGLPAQIDYHEPDALDGNINPHLHAIVSARPMDRVGWCNRKGDIAERIFRAGRGSALKVELASAINRAAQRHGLQPLVHLQSSAELGRALPEPKLPRDVFRHPERDANRRLLRYILPVRAAELPRTLSQEALEALLEHELHIAQHELAAKRNALQVLLHEPGGHDCRDEASPYDLREEFEPNYDAEESYDHDPDEPADEWHEPEPSEEDYEPDEPDYEPDQTDWDVEY